MNIPKEMDYFNGEDQLAIMRGYLTNIFGECEALCSHPDYKNITDEQYNNRMILRQAMMNHGFEPLDEEWWHFTLKNEPYPDTYFTFPVSEDSVSR